MEESTTIKCTNFCGFSVTGESRYCQDVFDDHEHQEPVRWYEAVFSMYGVIIILILSAAVVAIVTKDPNIF